MSAAGYSYFSDWGQLVSCVAHGYGLSFELWYHAPLDHAPRRVHAKVLRGARTVRVTPAGRSFRSVFAFIADAGHVGRFCTYPRQDWAVPDRSTKQEIGR